MEQYPEVFDEDLLGDIRENFEKYGKVFDNLVLVNYMWCNIILN